MAAQHAARCQQSIAQVQLVSIEYTARRPVCSSWSNHVVDSGLGMLQVDMASATARCGSELLLPITLLDSWAAPSMTVAMKKGVQTKSLA